MSLELIIAGVIIIALTIYSLTGGADYGGGVLDLLAFGKRTKGHRRLIESAMGPVWEANHVWMILIIVLLFTCFSKAFAIISIALHIPLTIVLLGIVLRGSAFIFRKYDTKKDSVQKRWSYVFSISSIITPIFLGVTLGAIASGRIKVEKGIVTSGFFETWLTPFSFALGVFVLALFTFLSATYLTVEADSEDLKEDFRLRALITGFIVGILALVVFFFAGEYAPSVRAGLTTSGFALPLHIFTGIFAVGAFYTLWKRKYHAARVFAAGQVAFIIWGWALSQFPNIIEPNITIYQVAAPQITLKLVLIALGLGSLVLFPSFFYLFWIFKATETKTNK